LYSDAGNRWHVSNCDCINTIDVGLCLGTFTDTPVAEAIWLDELRLLHIKIYILEVNYYCYYYHYYYYYYNYSKVKNTTDNKVSY
jgi:hypothetical protein